MFDEMGNRRAGIEVDAMALLDENGTPRVTLEESFPGVGVKVSDKNGKTVWQAPPK